MGLSPLEAMPNGRYCTANTAEAGKRCLKPVFWKLITYS